MVREIPRQAAAVLAVAAMLACGSDGPVGPSASSTTTTTSAATTSTTTTTTAPPATTTTSSTTTTPIVSTTSTTTSVPIVIITTTTTSIPIIITTSSTTTTTSTTTSSTTTTAAVSFAAVVWPQMASCDFCHTEFNSAGTAFTFAFNRSAANSLNSLFYRKPAGLCTLANSCAGATPPAASNPTGHNGGAPWPPGSAGANAAAQWIQGGRGI